MSKQHILNWLVLGLLVACVSYLAVTTTTNRLYPATEPQNGLECIYNCEGYQVFGEIK
jgi:hypothetical protein